MYPNQRIARLDDVTDLRYYPDGYPVSDCAPGSIHLNGSWRLADRHGRIYIDCIADDEGNLYTDETGRQSIPRGEVEQCLHDSYGHEGRLEFDPAWSNRDD